jgi:2-dehydropantoate 2-reductase
VIRRVLVFGAGAIGTYVGGSLALSGLDVVFLERPEFIDMLLRSGLHLEFDGAVHDIPQPNVAGSIQSALDTGPFDIGVLAIKSNDTASLLDTLRPYQVHLPAILDLQNGVDNEPAVAAALGESKVIAGTVTSAIGRKGLGDILLERRRGLGVAAGHPRSAELVEALNNAGLNARLYPEAGPMKWSKLLTNLLGNTTSAILDMPPGEIFYHPGLYRLEIDQLRETLQVMRGLGYHAVDLPDTPVPLLAFGARWLPPAISRPILQKAVSGGRGGKMPSFHIDLRAARKETEVEYLNGAVVRHAKPLGISTPVNRFLTETLGKLSCGGLPLDTYTHQPAKLLADYQNTKRTLDDE